MHEISTSHPIEITAPDLGFWELVRSDHLAARSTPEPRWRTRALMIPRILLNPSLQLAFLVRAAQKGPRALWYPIRLLQVWLFSSEIYLLQGPGAIEIGPGVRFPHPVGILIGPGTRIGSDVTLYHNLTIGPDRHWTPGETVERSPVFGDRCVVYSNGSVQGPRRIGQDAVVGAYVVLDEDVPPGALKTRNRLRTKDQWPGERGRFARGTSEPVAAPGSGG